MTQLWQADTIIVEDAARTISFSLDDGMCIAVLVRGASPVISMLDGEGSYDLRADFLDGAEPLAAVCLIPIAHAGPWGQLGSETVGRMLDRVARAIPLMRMPTHEVRQ